MMRALIVRFIPVCYSSTAAFNVAIIYVPIVCTLKCLSHCKSLTSFVQHVYNTVFKTVQLLYNICVHYARKACKNARPSI